MPNAKDKQALLQELEELARFPEMNPGPVLRLDTTGTIILANTGAKKIFNLPNLIGVKWQDICPGMDAEHWKEVTSCSRDMGFEADVNERCYLFTHVCPANSENYFVFGSDVTEIKLIELDRLVTIDALETAVYRLHDQLVRRADAIGVRDAVVEFPSWVFPAVVHA